MSAAALVVVHPDKQAVADAGAARLVTALLDLQAAGRAPHVSLTGGSDSPSTDLLAAWLAQTLRCPVRRARSRSGTGMVSVRLERRSGAIDLVRPDGAIATLSQPGQPVRRISLARRATAECLADELRRLDPDEIYEEAIRSGLARIGTKTVTASEAVREGEAPSVKEAERESRRIARASAKTASSEMVQAATPASTSDTAVVKKAAARKLAKAKSSTKGTS